MDLIKAARCRSTREVASSSGAVARVTSRSWIHACRDSTSHLEEQGGVWMIRDLSSANGTWINGCRIGQAMLHDADTISAGDTILSVVSEPDTLQCDPSHAVRDGAHSKTKTTTYAADRPSRNG